MDESHEILTLQEILLISCRESEEGMINACASSTHNDVALKFGLKRPDRTIRKD